MVRTLFIFIFGFRPAVTFVVVHVERHSLIDPGHSGTGQAIDALLN